jgi:hypothetical protein
MEVKSFYGRKWLKEARADGFIDTWLILPVVICLS